MSNENKSITSEPTNSYKDSLVYMKYFQGTKQLIHNFSDKDLKIESNLRKFRAANSEEGYDEIFPNENQVLFGGISPQISFLYPPKIRGYQNRIGFRYYKENPLTKNDNNPYFTLIYSGKKKCLILEKDIDINITDNKGTNFMIKELDCLDIIFTIIKNKLSEYKDYLNYPNIPCEILGFIYAAKYSKNNINNIEILEPYNPNPLFPETMKENNEIITNKIFLEPLIFNNHVSLLLFYYKEKGNIINRKNILFDMSSAHYESLLNKDPIFKEEMGNNLEKFPSNNIQIGSPSTMWFYSIMIYLLNNKLEFPIITNNNTLYIIIQIIYDLFNIKEEDIIKQKIPIREIEEDIESDNFLSYKDEFKTFTNIEETLDQFSCSNNIGQTDLENYQKIFLEIRNNINTIELNYKYYLKIFNKELVNRNQIIQMRDFLDIAERTFSFLIEALKKKYNCLNGLTFYDEMSEKNKDIELISKDLESTIEIINKSFNNIKFSLLSKNKLNELLFGDNDVLLNLLDN